MSSPGFALLLLALAVEAYGIAASVYGVRSGKRRFVESGRRAVYSLAIVLTIAFGVLELAFLRSDFSYSVVAEHSSTTTSTFYRAAAPWSA